MDEPEPQDLPINGVLDLQTFRPADVGGLIPDYLAECRKRGILQVRIIHGKGTGALRETVPAILRRLAVASEPCIFWRGEGAGEVIAGIEVPAGVGKLVPAADNLNGPSGRSLDECFLTPMGITRRGAWLCDIVPHSCRNPKQDVAIQREYAPLMGSCGLPEVSLPPVPNPLCDDERRRQVVDELVESQASTVVLLGDEPIRWFLRSFDDRWRRLGDFGMAPET